MIDDDHLRKFAAVYAEAVLTLLDSREHQWLTWDGHSHAFDFGSVEMDPPGVPVMLVVDDDWSKVLGDVGEIIDPESSDFDADALRNAIEAQITDEGFGERLLRTFQERLEKLQSGELDEDEDDEPPERNGSVDEDQG